MLAQQQPTPKEDDADRLKEHGRPPYEDQVLLEELATFIKKLRTKEIDWPLSVFKEQAIRDLIIPIGYAIIKKKIYGMLSFTAHGKQLPLNWRDALSLNARKEIKGFKVEFGKPLRVRGMARYFYGFYKSVGVVVFWKKLPKLAGVAYTNTITDTYELNWRSTKITTPLDVEGWNLEDVLAILGAPTVADHLKRYGYEVKARTPQAKEFINSYLETALAITNRIRQFLALQFRRATPKKPAKEFSVDIHIYCPSRARSPEPYTVIHVLPVNGTVWTKIKGQLEDGERVKLLDEIFVKKNRQLHEAILTAFKEHITGCFTAQVALKMWPRFSSF